METFEPNSAVRIANYGIQISLLTEVLGVRISEKLGLRFSLDERKVQPYPSPNQQIPHRAYLITCNCNRADDHPDSQPDPEGMHVSHTAPSSEQPHSIIETTDSSY